MVALWPFVLHEKEMWLDPSNGGDGGAPAAPAGPGRTGGTRPREGRVPPSRRG